MIFDKVIHLNRFINKQTADLIIADYLNHVVEKEFEDKFAVADGITRRRVALSTKIGGGEIEAHDEHIDVQILIEGNETLEVMEREGLEEKSTNRVTDFILFDENSTRVSSFIPLKKDFALVLWPYDAHKTQISVNGKEEIFLKAVYKVHKSKI